MKRICVITGNYGSGKTEVSINLALKLKKEYENVTIVDLDIVNPYFRTKDAEEMLKSKGIKMIAPKYANTNLDLPTLPSDIISVFEDDDSAVILDVGGDDDGAVVLGGFNNYFNLYEYESYMVVNVKRPDTSSIEGIKELKEKIEAVSRLKINGFINNTNLLEYTTVEMLEEGHKIIEKVSLELGIPIKYISGKKEILDKISDKIKTNKLNLSMQLKLPWQNREEEVNWQK